MKLKSKILVLLMSAAMVITCLPMSVFAIEAPPGDPVEPVSVAIQGPDGIMLPGDYCTDAADIFSGSQWVTVTYSDSSEREFEFVENRVVQDGGTDTHKWSGFLAIEDANFLDVNNDLNRVNVSIKNDVEDDKEQYEVYKDTQIKEGNNPVELRLTVPYTDQQGGLRYKTFDTVFNVWASLDRIVSMEFVPAAGFTIEGEIGSYWLSEEDFFGEGNEIHVTTETLVPGAEGQEPYYKTYPPRIYRFGTGTTEYNKGVEGFYEVDSGMGYSLDKFEFLEYGAGVTLKKGLNKVEVPCSVYLNGLQGEVPYKLTVEIAANKYGVYGNWPQFDYDGTKLTRKEFKKKFVLRDSMDNVIPASKYTYTWKDKKNLGYYELKIKFKDSKYPDTYIAGFDITLKAPKLTKVTGGKKKLTVKWKKFNKAALKKTDCMFIEIATDKYFSKNFNRYKVSASSLKKKNSKVIKSLKGGKKYYVRAYLRSTDIKDVYGKYKSYSNDSNIKAATVKKK